PADAKLVRFGTGGRYNYKGKQMPPYYLGFLVRPATEGNSPRLLVGTQEIQLREGTHFEVVEPTPDVSKSINPHWSGRDTFALNVGLALALQCKARGWDDLAQELWTSSLNHDCGDLGLF